MILQEALRRTADQVAPISSHEATLEAEVLLMHLLGLSRAQLYCRLGEELSPDCVEPLAQLVARRRAGEPLAYLVGHREFYGLDFIVNHHVLIPRPETELLVDQALTWARGRSAVTSPVVNKSNHPRRSTSSLSRDGGGEPPYPEPVEGYDKPLLVADVGTGCGSVVVALAKHLPQAQLFAVDISATALEVAQENAHRHRVADRISFFCGDLLAPLPQPVDLIVANLPYVRDDELDPLLAEVRPGVFIGEPDLALRGGPDGLDPIRRFLDQAPPKLRPGGTIFLEVAYNQAEAVVSLAGSAFGGCSLAQVGLTRDWAGWNRVVGMQTSASYACPERRGEAVEPPVEGHAAPGAPWPSC